VPSASSTWARGRAGRRPSPSTEPLGAVAVFRRALACEPAAGPSRLYLRRAEAYLRAPPPSWDGVYVGERNWR